VPRGKADIANIALRVFLQEMGEVYDRKRDLDPYNRRKHFSTIERFFDERCCYCGDELRDDVVEDHLIPINHKNLGLHAWGNIVPSCRDCNSKKHGREWHAYLAERAGADTPERYKRITAFVKHYQYAPDLTDLREIAADLYAEVGGMAMSLISLKVARLKAVL
jgi:hypothetical protein